MHTCILPIDHLLLENNSEARKHRKNQVVGEVLVVFNTNGDIVGMLPPSPTYCNEGEFRDSAPLLTLLQTAHACGTLEAQNTTMKAPEGWILWQDLQPGTLAYDGHDQHILRFREPFSFTSHRYMGYGKPTQGIESLADTVWLPSERTVESVRPFADMKHPQSIFLKIRREGLSQAQCLEIREMCNRGDFGVFSPTFVL